MRARPYLVLPHLFDQPPAVFLEAAFELLHTLVAPAHPAKMVAIHSFSATSQREPDHILSRTVSGSHRACMYTKLLLVVRFHSLHTFQ